MAVGRISGPLLKRNLIRDGIELTVRNTISDPDVLYIDVVNGRIGVNTDSPTTDLDINGTTNTTALTTGIATIDNVEINDSTIKATVGNLNIEAATEFDQVIIPRASIPDIQGNVEITGNLHATGNITAGGNITLGDANTDDIVFNADINSNIIPNTTDSFDLGSTAQRWAEGHFADIFVDNITINTSVGNTVSLLSNEVNKIYVHLGGDDTAGNGENIAAAYRTLKHALSQSSNGDTIVLGAGVFEEEFPLTVPEGVTIVGSGVRATTIKPTIGTRDLDCFYLGGDSSVQNLSILDMLYNIVNDTGYAFQFANNTLITRRSPYVKDVSVLNRGSAPSSADPFGFATGDAGRGIKVDGARVVSGSIEPAMLFDSVTLIVPNSKGLELTNGARVEWLNSFVYFADIGIEAYEGSQGKYSNGKTYLELSGISGTITAGDVGLFVSTDNSTVASVTVESVSGNTIVIDGRIDDFEGFDFTPASISFLPSGATATEIVRYDRKDFGAELRSIASANVYGTRGVRAQGADVRLRLSSHDFGYIGSGADFSNNDLLINTANEVIEIDEGRVFYSSTDQYGDYRIGDLFLVDQDTGTVTFNGGQFEVTNLTGITFTDGTNITVVDPSKIKVGNLQLSDNTLESLIGGINIVAFNNIVTIDSTLNVTDQTTLSSVNVEDLTAGRVVLAGTDGELEDNSNLTFDGTLLTVTGNVEVTGDVSIAGGDLTTTALTFNLLNTNANTVNAFGAGEVINVGAATSTVTLNNDLTVKNNVSIEGNNLTTTQTSFNLLDSTATTIQAFGAAETLVFASSTGTTTFRSNVVINNDLEIKGGDITTNNLTFNLINDTATTINFAGNATILNIGRVGGTTTVLGQSTLSSVNVEDLTAGRVVLAGTNGELEDNSNLTFDGTTLIVTGNAEITGNLVIGGNLTLGDQTTDTITVVADFTSNLIPDQDITYNLGSNTNRWNNLYSNILNVSEFNNGTIKISSNIIENIVANQGIEIKPNGTGTVEINSTTALKLPAGSESNRPTAPEDGQIRYNTSSARVENYNGEQWNTMANEDDAIAFAIALG